MALCMGVNNFVEIFDEQYYQDLGGGILEAFGKMFYNNLKVYLYPMKDDKGIVINSNNLKLHPRMKDFYKFFKYNEKVVDITDYNKSYLNIYSKEVLELINKGKQGWETMLPEKVSQLIKEKNLFGYQSDKSKRLD